MKQIVYVRRFLTDMQDVELASKQDEIYDTIDLLPSIPALGSRNLPDSIVEEFGDRVRKLVVDPFLVIYEIDEVHDQIIVYALVHQRAAW